MDLKTKTNLLAAALLLAAAANGFSQPVITTQPQTQTNVVGTDVTFTVEVTGTQPLAYQWQFNGADLANATNRALSFTNVQSRHAGSYVVVVSNTAGTATSKPALLAVVPTLTRITIGPVVNDGGSSAQGAWAD